MLKFIVYLCVGVGLLSAGAKYRPLTDREIRSRVVRLEMAEGGFCTGEQVLAPNGKQYTLTASHCMDGKKKLLAKFNGKSRYIKLIVESPVTDLALYQGIPELPALKLAKSIQLHEEVRTFTHGARHANFQTKGEALEIVSEGIPLDMPADNCSKPKNKVFDTFFGPVCGFQINLQVITAWAVPGSSGGPAVNAFGEQVGVVIGISGPFTYIVPLSDVKAFLTAVSSPAFKAR